MTLHVPNVFKMLPCSMFTKTETTKPNALGRGVRKDATCRNKRTPRSPSTQKKLHYRTLRPSKLIVPHTSEVKPNAVDRMHMQNRHGIPPEKGKQNSGDGDHTMADRGSRKTQELVAADRTEQTRKQRCARRSNVKTE